MLSCIGEPAASRCMRSSGFTTPVATSSQGCAVPGDPSAISASLHATSGLYATYGSNRRRCSTALPFVPAAGPPAQRLAANPSATFNFFEQCDQPCRRTVIIPQLNEFNLWGVRPTLNVVAVDAAVSTLSPVPGLQPVRTGRRFARKIPKPTPAPHRRRKGAPRSLRTPRPRPPLPPVLRRLSGRPPHFHRSRPLPPGTSSAPPSRHHLASDLGPLLVGEHDRNWLRAAARTQESEISQLNGKEAGAAVKGVPYRSHF